MDTSQVALRCNSIFCFCFILFTCISVFRFAAVRAGHELRPAPDLPLRGGFSQVRDMLHCALLYSPAQVRHSQVRPHGEEPVEPVHAPLQLLHQQIPLRLHQKCRPGHRRSRNRPTIAEGQRWITCRIHSSLGIQLRIFFCHLQTRLFIGHRTSSECSYYYAVVDGIQGHKWSLSAFLKHLKANNIDTVQLMQSIEDVIIKR